MSYNIITWEKIDEAILKLSESIADSKEQYEVIYGPPRGGLIPGVMLSHKLDIPLVLNIEEVWRIDMQHKKVLIVDDIADTGNTLKYFDDKKFDIATLYVRVHTSKITPRYNAFDINNDNWLLFPWETKDSTVSHI